ncbi:MAG: DUF3014 domain-containing protein [Gammaproteobacteria bacterium]
MNEETKNWIWYAIPIAVVVAIGAALYYGYRERAPQSEPQAQQQAPVEPVESEPVIKHPIEPTAESEEPLPTIEESDPSLQQALVEAFGRPLEQYLVPKSIIRHTVATIDNLPRKKAAVQMWPLKPMSGEFLVKSEGEVITLDEKNFARYTPLVSLFEKADTQQLVRLYRRYYPLLQQAYADLGYPDGYFNDRLIEVIDHLLETPEIRAPIELTQPGMFYEYADPSLENRSAGQKLLIRMGPQNTAIIKRKILELREELASKQE